MKKTILAIALALAVSPFTFAAGKQAAAGQAGSDTATTKTKKHTRKARKTTKKHSKAVTEPAAAAPAQK